MFPALKPGFTRDSPRPGLVEGRSWAWPARHGTPAQHHPRDCGAPPCPPRPSRGSTLGSVLSSAPHSFLSSRTIGDRMGEAKASGNLGNTLKVLGRFDEAVVCCQRHLDIAQEQGDKVGRRRWPGAPAGTGPRGHHPGSRAPRLGWVPEDTTQRPGCPSWEEDGERSLFRNKGASGSRRGHGAEPRAPVFHVRSSLTDLPTASTNSACHCGARGRRDWRWLWEEAWVERLCWAPDGCSVSSR